MDAVSALVTVPPTPPPPLASSAIAPEVAVATNRPTSANATIHHVNQSNNNIHHSGTNSLSTTPTAAAAAAVAVASNVGNHSSNSSCSSGSSSSSNSSGYGSTTTTPTNNYDFQQQQQQITPTTTPIPTTPIAIAEPIIPVATVAAVTPFYNESIATHNLEQLQLQQQQHSHHLLQQQHHPLPPTHVQPNTHQHQHQHQPQPQYLPRQQYYPSYADYQQSPPPTHNLTGSASPSAPTYNMGVPGSYEISPSAATSYAVGSQYKAPGLSTLNYERSAAVRTTPYNLPQQMSTSEMQNKPLAQHHSQQFAGVLSSTKQRSSSLIGSSSNVGTSKPQAAATPFYAQPLAQSHTNSPTAYYDNVKHKMPLEYHEAYGNNSPAAANTYHQQQKYYAAAKSQLKETAAYGSPAATGLGGKSLYSSTSNFFPTSATTYDKYLYPPHAPAAGYSTSQHVGSETPPDQNNYRKPVAANQLNSTSWPWGIDYNAGNSRTIPPPPTNHIPTATVAPTHATYLTPNPTSLTREPFYMNPEKYALKYDKYPVPPAYQQPYVNPTPSRHHMWPSSATANNLAPLNERHPMGTAPTVPPPHGIHSSPYFSANSASALNSRQSCCNQPYQTQNCYYPAPTHAAVNRLPYNQPTTVSPSTGSFLTNQQPPLGQSPHLNALTASCKFGGILTDYGNVNKVKNTNDLYLSSHRYDTNPPPPPPPPHNFGYGSGHSSQSLYASNAHQSMVHGPHDPMPANSANYTNDLSLTTSNFESFHSHLDNHLGPQTLAGLQQHNQQQQQQQQSPPPAYAATVAKRALLDYRKPIQPQPPPPTINEECFPSLSAATIITRDYNQHDVLNTPETTTSFNEYEPQQESSSYIAHKTRQVIGETNSVAESSEGNKNLSLRDFIANWNDDEEEYQNNEEMNFDQSSVIQEVLQATPNEQEQVEAVAMEVETSHESTEVVKSSSCSIETKEDNQIIAKDFTAAVPAPTPIPTLATATDSSEVEPDNSQYANLPDIIIDIEKSNSVNNSTINLANSAVSEAADANNTSLNLTDFDVEKELDELKIKKPTPQEHTKDLNDINDPMKSVNTPQLSPCKNLNTQLSFEELNLEHNNKTVPINPLANSATRQTSDIPEHYFKDMEGYESGNSRQSNESAFEKEYETFINRITHETSTKAHDKCKDMDQEVEFAQNVQDFSKFYKRKRKLKEDELKSSTAYQQYKKKLKSSMMAKHKNSNFPQVYTKKSRNRSVKKSSTLPQRRKPFSLYYKAIHSLRRISLKRLKRARDYLTELKEKHLPLIKRQSIKNYSHCLNDSLFKPQTLKAFCIAVINTEEFRQRIIIPTEKEEKKQPTSTCLEADNDKHICPDPTCETCEVLRSLMVSESIATPALEPANESVVGQLNPEEESREKITVIDEELNIVDLNLKKDEYIVISTDDENLEYAQENLQILDVTKTVPDINAQSKLQTESYFEMSSVISPAKLTTDIAEQFCFQTAEVDGESEIPTTVHDINVPLAVQENIKNESIVPALETLERDHKVGEMSKVLSSPANLTSKGTEKESENSDSCESDSESSRDSTSSSSSSSSSGSSSSSSSSSSSDDEASEDEEKENSVRNRDNNHLSGVENCKNENENLDSVQSVDPKTDDQEISVNFHNAENLESSDSEVDDIVTENIRQESPKHPGNPETNCSVENSAEKLLDASVNISFDIPAENLRSIGFQNAVRSLDSESSVSESEDDEKVKKTSEISSIPKDLNTKADINIAISEDESMSSVDSDMENNQGELKNSMGQSKKIDMEREEQNMATSDQLFLTEHQETHQDKVENMGLKDLHEHLSEEFLSSEENEHLHGDVETETSPQTIFTNETKVNASNDHLDLCPPLKHSHENLSDHSLCSEEDESPDNDLKAGKCISIQPTNPNETEPMFRKETKDGGLDLSMPLKHSHENLSEDFFSTDNEDSANDLKADKNISLKPTNLNEPESIFEEKAKENIAEADLYLSTPLKASCENLSENSFNSEEDESSDNDLETAATNFNEPETNFTKERKENRFGSPRDSNEEDLCPVSNQKSCESHSERDAPTHDNLSEASLNSENNENSDNDMETVKNLSTTPTKFDHSTRIFSEVSKSPEISGQHRNEDDLYSVAKEKHDNISEYSLSSVEDDNSDTDTESVKCGDEPEEIFTKETSNYTAEKLSYSEVSQEYSFKEKFHSKQTSLEKGDPEKHDENLAEISFKQRTLDDHSEASLSSEESENSDSDIHTDRNFPKLSGNIEKASEDFNYQTFSEAANQESQTSLLENNMEISNDNDLCSAESFANKFPKNSEEFSEKSIGNQQKSQVLEAEKDCGNISEEDNSNDEMNESKRETFEDDFMQHIVREYRRAQVSENLENLVSLVNSNRNSEVVLPAKETLLEFLIGNETSNGDPKETIEAHKLNNNSLLDIDQQDISQQSIPAVTEDMSDTPGNNELSESIEQNFVRRENFPATFPGFPVAELHAKNLNLECKNLEALSENSSQFSESDESTSEMGETNIVISDSDNTKGLGVCGIPKSPNTTLDQNAEKEIEASNLKNFSEENEANDEHLKKMDVKIGHAKPSNKSESTAKDDENVHNSELEKECAAAKSNQQEDMEVYEQQPKRHLEQEVDVESTTQETESILEESLTKVDKDTCGSKNSEYSKAKEQAEVITTEDNLSDCTCKGISEPNTSEELITETAEEKHYKEPEISKQTTSEKGQTNLEHFLSSALLTEELSPQISADLEKEGCLQTTEMEDSQSSSCICNIANESETQIPESLEEEIDSKIYANVEGNPESEVKITQECDSKGLTTYKTEISSEVNMLESSIKAASSIRAERNVLNTIQANSETERSQREYLDNSAKLSGESEVPLEISTTTTEGEAIPEIKPDIRLSNETETNDICLELAKEILYVPIESSVEKEIPPNTIAIGLDSETCEDNWEIQKENSDVPSNPCGFTETSQTVEEHVPEAIDDNSLEIQKNVFDTSIDSSEEQQNSRTKAQETTEKSEIADISTELSEKIQVYQTATKTEPIPQGVEDISMQIQKENSHILSELFSQTQAVRIRNPSESVREDLENISAEVQRQNSIETSKENTIPQTRREMEVEDISRDTEIEIPAVSAVSEVIEICKTQEENLDVSASSSEDSEIAQYPTEAEDEYSSKEEIFRSKANVEENPETVDDISSEIQKEIQNVCLETKLKAIPQPTIEVETEPEAIGDPSMVASAVSYEDKEIPLSATKIEEKSSGEKEIYQSKSDIEDIPEIQNEGLDISAESEQEEVLQITSELEADSQIIDDNSLETQKENSNVSDTSGGETAEEITAASCEKAISQITFDTEGITEAVGDSSHMCTEISVAEQTNSSSFIRDTVPETHGNMSLDIQKQVTNDSPESSDEIQPISKIETEVENLNKLTTAEELSSKIESSNKFCVEGDVVVQPSEQSSKTICGKMEVLPDNDNLRNSTESPNIALSSEIDAANTIDESGELQDLGRSLDIVATSKENSEAITNDSEEDSFKSAPQHSKPDLKITNEKASTSEEEFSGDFYGFKNQSSFEDESEDFHGFEDLEEVARIRQEIEQLNEDSTANDGFLNYAMLNKELHKTSTNSLSAGSSVSEINELEALEKELSQHQTIANVVDDDDKKKETEMVHLVKVKAVLSTNDIEHIKQMLESDEEAQQPDDDENKDNNSKVKFEENSNSNPKDILKDIIKPVNVNSVIPKLSDLCRAALNSSLHSNRNLGDTEATPTILVERELSVEEALAEMYRQAGVLLSDPEDCDNETAPMANEEAHDVLLINLQEILNSDNNDVYVLQCDMNDSVLNVIPANEEEQNAAALDNNGGRQAERVNTVQFIGILDTQNNEPQIHIISSDSESEVIILSDDDDENDFVYRPFVAQHERVTIPFINDNDNNVRGGNGNGNDSLSDISTIHHEEIVPDNLNKFLQEEFYKYLHEKYVQRNISKYYHANRVIKKYRKRYVKTKRH